MNKRAIIILIILAITISVVTYFNYDAIEEYIENKQWQMADSIATIQLDDVSQVASGKDLILLTKSSIDLYKNSASKIGSISVASSELITDSANDYTIIGDKTSGNIYVLKETQTVWETQITGTLLGVEINKNGYSAITYTQSGYKSVIRVLKPTGDELCTTFLGSTYALDVAISNNNKTLAVAEVDTDGIKLSSNVKVIEITNNNDAKFNTVYTDNDSLILDIEYTENNKLLVLKDDGVATIDNENTVTENLSYTYSEMVYSTIENSEDIIVVQKSAVGIFGSECKLKIYGEKNEKEYELNSTPQSICAKGKTIALNMGNEVIFVSTNGKLIKRYSLGSQLKDIKLYENGRFAALVFRNKIELVEI